MKRIFFKTEFIKADFEKKFNLVDYKTAHAREDVTKVSRLQFSIEDLENDYFEYWNVFKSIKYDNGTFTFKWWRLSTVNRTER
jgi:hypothetical protein